MGEKIVEFNEFDDMTENQKLFCDLYLQSGNASKSAIGAGYSEASAASQGSRLLKNPKIVKYINHLRKEQALSTEVTADHVIAMIANLANPISGANHNIQLKALDLLGKHFGIYTNELSIKQETNINIHNPANLSEKELNKMLEEYESLVIEAEYEEVDD